MQQFYFVRSRGRCLRPNSLKSSMLSAKEPDDLVVILQFTGDSEVVRPLSLDHNLELNADFEAIATQLHSTTSMIAALTTAPSATAILPRCTIKKDNEIVLVTGMGDSGVTLLDFRPAKIIDQPWPSNNPLLDTWAIVKIVERYLKNGQDLSVRDLVGHIANATESIDIDSMREELTAIYSLSYAAQITAKPPLVTPPAIKNILDLRLRISELRNLVAKVDKNNEKYTVALAENVSELDALGLVSMSRMLFDFQIQLSRSREIQQREADYKQQHDRKVAQLVAAFVLPGLWFAFLGINVIPNRIGVLEVQTTGVMAGATAVAFALAIIGWLLVKYLNRGSDNKND